MALSSVAALSSSANASVATTTLEVKIKEERHDEAEIREMAAKMVEANKAKIASTTARQTAPNTNMQHLVQPGQPGIMNYMNRTGVPVVLSNKSGVVPVTDKDKKSNCSTDKKPPCDDESSKGRFGWVTLGKCYIPYIIRYGEKYCAVRMVEMKLLNKYLTYLHADIYSCTCIRSYYITDIEARLLNEINLKHCEGQFGRESFTAKDLVVRFQDACEFYNFLDVCYNKLIISSNNPQDKCGFIRINGESVVPYTVRDNLKYVPLFYFEGETDNLKLKAEKLEGWDLAYLKFCCKVQGIRNELFAHETCSVISLDDIKSYFPPGTVFEDYWPSKVVDSQLLLSGNKGNTVPVSAGMWTKQPNVPPPPPPSNSALQQVVPSKPTIPVTTTNAPNVQPMANGWAGLVGGQQFQPGQLVRMSHPPSAIQHQLGTSNPVSSGNVARTYNPVRTRPNHPGYQQYGPPVSMTLAPTQSTNHMAAAQPPPLVRVSGAPPQRTATTYTSSSGMGLSNVPPPNSLHMLGMSNSQQHHQMLPPPPHYSSQQRHTPPNSTKYPPPLIPVNGTTATRYPYQVTPGSDVIDLSSSPQSPHTNGQNGASDTRKLIQIGDTATSGSHVPYQVQKALVEGKMVPCINSKPFIYSELLMTVTDLVTHFFPAVTLANCTQILQEVLRVELFRGNRQQMSMLRDAGKCQSLTDNLPLIQVRDVMKYMPQLKYILSNRMNIESSPPAKRPRAS